MTTPNAMCPANRWITLACLFALNASALATDGTVQSTGLNVNGQLGLGNAADQLTFTTVYGLTDVVQVASGSAHTLALRADGTVWAWGNNTQGQLGIGSTSFRSLVPVQVTGIANAVAVAAGHMHSLALLADGTVKTWGSNGRWQLGMGNAPNSSSPVPVVSGGFTNIVAIEAGMFHCIALRNDGRVFAWGDNTFGQLGVVSESNGPGLCTIIPGLTTVSAIASGHYHNLALLSNGAVHAWGQNGRGQIGNGTTTNALVPIQVTAIGGATAVAAGGMHSLALLGNGTVRAWGKNSSGQLGLGTTTDALTPQLISSLNSMVAIAAGSAHSIARRVNGIVLAWGFNNYGQLGDGTQIDSSLPIFINDALGATTLACGDFQTFTIGRQPLCPGDIAPPPNGNGSVDVQDLLALIGVWGACANPSDCPADLAPPDGDDVVNVSDLLVVIGAWGACP